MKYKSARTFDRVILESVQVLGTSLLSTKVNLLLIYTVIYASLWCDDVEDHVIRSEVISS